MLNILFRMDTDAEWKIFTANNVYKSSYIGNDCDREWKGDFCFVQGSDPQFGMKAEIDNPNYDPATADWTFEIEMSRLAVEKVNRLEPKPRFFIICGDLTHEFPHKSQDLKNRQIKEFKKIFCRVKSEIPLICVCGNHDVGNTPTTDTIIEYRKNYGNDYFSFWCGGVLFIVLNSQLYKDSKHVGKLAEEQDQWLDVQLNEAKGKQIVCFSHIPWFINTVDEPENIFNIPYETRIFILEKLYKAGVRYFFCGHYHRNAGSCYKEMEIIITSAIGVQLGPNDSGVRIVSVEREKLNHSYSSFRKTTSAANY